jgi:SecD/SecF fusion protein
MPMRTPRWKLLTYALVLLVGVITALPNLLTETQRAVLPNWLAANHVTLGLDLRGGSHLVLEVDSKALIRERLVTLADDARSTLREHGMADARVAAAADGVTVTLAPGANRSDAIGFLRTLQTNTYGFRQSASDIAVDPVPATDTGIRLTLSPSGLQDRINAATEQSIEIVRERIDQVGVAEPTIQRVGNDRILVQLPGVQDPARIKTLLGSTAKLSFHRVVERESRPSFGVMTLPDRLGKTQYAVERRAILTGEHLVNAAPGFESQTNQPIVSFRFDRVGARLFGNFTKNNVGVPLAIVLDGKVLSAPVIREPIMGGSGQISGHFTVQEAQDLSALLRAGALPAPLTVIEERTVGADLGSDAVAMGAWTSLAGFVLVCAFMVFLYGTWGMIADLALVLNLILTFGILGMFGATLTLPGIAGIVLGVGIAVDANVLINERIREETRKGKSAFLALDAGFRRAFATIIDSNLTTLIATTLLFAFGSGSVRGFAVTMGVGIVVSLFTAISVVRVVMEELIRRRKPKRLDIHPMIHLIPSNTQISFMRARLFGIGLSMFLSVASVILFFKPGLNYGIDFRGGIQVELASKSATDLGTLRAQLSKLDAGEVALQQLGDGSHVLVRIQRQAGGDAAQSALLDRMKAAVKAVQPDATFERTEVVGPKVSGELATAGISAIAFAIAAMFVYIWFRFEWPFAVGAIVTLLLDITKTVGFFALTQLDFNLTAIAALLTLIGYTVNDKIVVYDRIRENMRLYKKLSLREIIDRSINESLTRSVYTSATAFLAILPMSVAGGSAVSSFAIPMIFGIVVATSSSIFIAAPILLFLGDWRRRRQVLSETEAKAADGEQGAHAAAPAPPTVPAP